MLKLTKRLICVMCILFILSSFAWTASADDGITITAEQDKKSGYVTLECQIEGNVSSERVAFIILRPGKQAADIDLENPAAFLEVVSYFDEKSTDETGKVTFTFPLDKTAADGKYLVMVGGTYLEVPESVYFDYTNFGDESKLIRINNATTPEKMRAVIDEEFSALDKAGYSTLTDGEEEKLIKKLCAVSEGEGFESIASFALTFNGYVAVGMLNDAEDKDAKEAVLESKSEALNLSLELGEKVGTEDAFSAFAEKYDGAYFTSVDEVSGKYLDMLLNNCVKNSKWSELYERLVLIKEGGADIDLSPYDEIKASESAAAKTMQALAGKNVTLETFAEALEDAINESGAKKETSSEKKPSGNSGGGTGGGTGGAGLTAAVKNDTGNTEAEDTKKEVFSDLENASWAKEAVNYLYNSGIVSGKSKGIFAPNDFVKREEFVKMLILALGGSETSGGGEFLDVEEGSWYEGYIYSAVEKGLVNGMEKNRFGTGEGLTREQLAAIIGRALGVADASEDLSAFKDGEDISDYAKAAVSSLYKKGVISGKGDGFFAPKDYTTRAEAAKMLYEVIKEAR